MERGIGVSGTGKPVEVIFVFLSARGREVRTLAALQSERNVRFGHRLTRSEAVLRMVKIAISQSIYDVEVGWGFGGMLSEEWWLVGNWVVSATSVCVIECESPGEPPWAGLRGRGLESPVPVLDALERVRRHCEPD